MLQLGLVQVGIALAAMLGFAAVMFWCGRHLGQLKAIQRFLELLPRGSVTVTVHPYDSTDTVIRAIAAQLSEGLRKRPSKKKAASEVHDCRQDCCKVCRVCLKCQPDHDPGRCSLS